MQKPLASMGPLISQRNNLSDLKAMARGADMPASMGPLISQRNNTNCAPYSRASRRFNGAADFSAEQRLISRVVGASAFGFNGAADFSAEQPIP